LIKSHRGRFQESINVERKRFNEILNKRKKHGGIYNSQGRTSPFRDGDKKE